MIFTKTRVFFFTNINFKLDISLVFDLELLTLFRFIAQKRSRTVSLVRSVKRNFGNKFDKKNLKIGDKVTTET